MLYNAPLRALIHRWKFQNHPGLSGYLATLAWQADLPATETPEVLVPVPTHWRRRLRRGFDHTWLLANCAYQLQQTPLGVAPWLSRRQATAYQNGLSRAARTKNVARAFAANTACEGRHIAVIDDVMTTGETANNCAQLLIDAGAKRVDIWCLARVPPTEQPV